MWSWTLVVVFAYNTGEANTSWQKAQLFRRRLGGRTVVLRGGVEKQVDRKSDRFVSDLMAGSPFDLPLRGWSIPGQA